MFVFLHHLAYNAEILSCTGTFAKLNIIIGRSKVHTTEIMHSYRICAFNNCEK